VHLVGFTTEMIMFMSEHLSVFVW